MTKHILLAEDHPVFRRMVEKAVIRAGFNCTAVTNGQEAVEFFKSQSFDLIIMDGNMPVMDGFEATKRIREDEANNDKSRIPIILHSSLVDPEIGRRCQDCGIDAFVPKSTGKPLIAVVKKFLE